MSWRGRCSSSRASLALLAPVLLVVACGGGGGEVGPPPTPTAISASSGNRQSGGAGAALPEPIVARVTSASGTGVEGAVVAFTAGASSGSVSTATATTNADGIVSAVWTVGTAAGTDLDTLRATVIGLEPAVFIASVTAASVAKLTVVSGNSQIGAPGQPLATPIVAVAQDQFGNPRSDVEVTWGVTAGGGAVSPTTSTTDSEGRASAVWTLGPNTGSHSVQAAVSAAPSILANFDATAPGGLTLASLSPTPLIEGENAVLTGIGFSATPSNNRVRIGDLEATVTAATGTSLTVRVPESNCQPARTVAVQVRVGGEASNTINQPVAPSSFTVAAVGEQVVLQNPAEFCLQFAASASPQDYLIGVQSTSEVVTSLTPVTLTSAAQPTLATSLPLPVLGRRPVARAVSLTPTEKRRQKHYAREAPIRAWERQHFGAMRAAAGRLLTTQGRSGALSVPGDLQVGDVIPLRVAAFDGDACSDFATVNAAVRVIGTRGLWLEDIENPAGGFTSEDFQSLSNLFDAKIYPTDVDYFGSPSDVDGNGRIAVLITKEVNAVGGLLGFVFGGDLFGRPDCQASNEAEIFYGATPDPNGTLALGTYTREQGLHDIPSTVAHEFAHIIQFSRRIAINAPAPLVVWEGEGQAVLAEEVVGHAVEGRAPGQNLGAAIAFNGDDPTSIDWYTYGFVQAAAYFGYDGSPTRVSGAPEECSWLANEGNGPCVQSALPYGAPWLLLRWLSDQYGPSFPGGEKGLQQAFINNPASGYANISAVVGVPIKTLLGQWAATLYTDDRAPTLSTRLTLPSWNLLDVYAGAPEPAQLTARSRAFASFRDAFSVRAGSAAYVRLSGASVSPTAVRIRNGSDGQLPSIMQVFVVRLQ
jgi:hypothetical protein